MGDFGRIRPLTVRLLSISTFSPPNGIQMLLPFNEIMNGHLCLRVPVSVGKMHNIVFLTLKNQSKTSHYLYLNVNFCAPEHTLEMSSAAEEQSALSHYGSP